MRTRLLPGRTQLAAAIFLAAAGWLSSALTPADFEIPAGGSDLVVDLSGRNLGEFARLVVVMATPSPPPSATGNRISLSLLNVSGNPRLQRILVDGALQVMQINTLDLSGTSVIPSQELIEFSPPQTILLSIRQVFINGTARPQTPLDFASFTEALYRLRVQSFAVTGWPVTNFLANFSQADNACRSKNFESVLASSAGIRRLANATVSATQLIDFSYNGIGEVVDVVFNSASLRLDNNRLSRLASVGFHPGASCRTQVTGQPEVHLNHNELTRAALLEAVFTSPSQPIQLTGLDLSGNPLLSGGTGSGNLKVKPEQRIRVAEWLRLRALVGKRDDVIANGTAQALASLLTGLFQSPGANGPVSLDLSDNQLTGLADASRVLEAWIGGSGGRLSELRLTGWAFGTDHLNLSELEPAVRPARWLDLGNLDDSGIRSVSVVANQSVEDSFDGMKAAWQGEIRLGSLPGGCCRAQNSDGRLLFCFIRPELQADHRRLICAGALNPVVTSTTLPRPSPTHPPPPTPALIFVLAAVAAFLAVLLVSVVLVGCIRRRQRRRSSRLRSQVRSRSPRRDSVGIEAMAFKKVDEA